MPQEAGAKCPLLTRAMPCVLGVLGIASAYYLWRQFKVTEKRVRIDEMHLYPVKGARGIKLDTWLVTPRGLQYDRHFMAVCAETSGFLTQRNCPNLATIDTAVTETHLILSKEGDSVQVPLCAGNNSAPSNQEVHSKVFRTPVRGLDCGDAVADFLTTHLGQPARLIRHVPDREHDRQTRFADACALLLANTASLRAVNRDLSQHNETQVVMGRFRPNIVVDTKKAFDEDRIKHVDFPSLRMKSLFQCARCIVTTTDQATGMRPERPASASPLSALRRMHANADGKPCFGQYIAPADVDDKDYNEDVVGRVSVGDELVLALR